MSYFVYRNLEAARQRYKFDPPSQKATGVNQWMNAKRVTIRNFSKAVYASAGFAETSEDATAVKPWGFIITLPKK